MPRAVPPSRAADKPCWFNSPAALVRALASASNLILAAVGPLLFFLSPKKLQRREECLRFSGCHGAIPMLWLPLHVAPWRRRRGASFLASLFSARSELKPELIKATTECAGGPLLLHFLFQSAIVSSDGRND